MASTNITGGTADGRLRKTVLIAAGWAACLAATPTAADTGHYYQLHRSKDTSFYLDRCYLCFDVSSLAGATITAVTLNLYQRSYSGTGPFKVYYKDWGTSLAAGDWSESLGTAASATVTPTSGAHSVAIELINVSNLLTSNGRFELANDDETTEPTAYNCFDFYHADEETNPKPNIDVTYTPAATGKPLHLYRHHSIPSLGGPYG